MNLQGIPKWVPVTPSDTAYVNLCGIRVTVAGTVIVQSVAGTDLPLGSLAVGDTLPGVFVRVMSTGTTGTVIGAQA